MTAPGMTPEETFRAAQWCDGYRAGLADAHAGISRDAHVLGERYAAGYERGHQWGLSHPAPAAPPAERPS